MAQLHVISETYNELFAESDKPDFTKGFAALKDKDLSESLAYYQNFLAHLNPAEFQFMQKEAKEALKRKLQLASLFMNAEVKALIAKKRHKGLPRLLADVRLCSEYLDQLNKPIQPLSQDLPPAHKDRPLTYLALSLGHRLSKNLYDLSIGAVQEMNEEFSADAPGTIKAGMDAANERRLYWIWAGRGGLTGVLFDKVLDPDFMHATQGQKTLLAPRQFEGYLSFMLYGLRWGLVLGMVMQAVVKGDDEKYRIQILFSGLYAYKFSLLNDSVWGIANMLCALWLTGSGTLGTSGDALTLALLGFDFVMNVWRLGESLYQFTVKMREISVQIKAVSAQAEAESDERKKKILLQQLNDLNEIKQKLILEHGAEIFTNINALYYSVMLFISFAIMTTPFMPVPAAAVLGIAVAGAAMCFGFTVLYNGVDGGIAVAKTYLEKRKTGQELQLKLREFDQMAEGDGKKLLYLQIKKLQCTQHHQQRVILYQSLQLMRSIMIDSLIPPFVIAANVFLPLGGSLGAMAGGAAAILVFKSLIFLFFNPREEKLPEFNEAEYEHFKSSLEKKPSGWSLLGFLGKGEPPEKNPAKPSAHS